MRRMFLASALFLLVFVLFLLVFALFNAQKTNAVAIKHVVDNQNVATQSNTQAFRGEMSNPVTGANLTAATLSAAKAENTADAATKVFAATAEVKAEKGNAQPLGVGYSKCAITQQQFGVTTGGTYSVILPIEVVNSTVATQLQFSGKEVADAPHLAPGVATLTAQFAQWQTVLANPAGMVT